MVVQCSSTIDARLAEQLDGLAQWVQHGVHLTSCWLDAYMQHGLEGSDPLILVAADAKGGTAKGALPLRIEYVRGTRWWHLRRLVPLARGPSDFFDLLTLPGMERQVAYAVCAWLHQNRWDWDLMVLDLLPGTSSSWQHLKTSLESAGFQTAVSHVGHFYTVDTRCDWEFLLKEKYRRSLRDLRTDMNRARRDGVDYRFGVRRWDIAGALDLLLEYYAERRAIKGHANYFASEQGRRFLYDVVRRYEARGWAELATIEGATGGLWAAHLGWVMRGVWYAYTIAMNESFAQYSPGKLLVYELVRRCCEDPGIRELNFMRGEAPYKAQFATGKHPYFTLTVVNPWSLRVRATAVASRIADLRDHLLQRRRSS